MGSLDRQGSDEDPTPSTWAPRDIPCSSTEPSYSTPTTNTSEEDNSIFVPETPSPCPISKSKRPLGGDSDCSQSKRPCRSSTGEEEETTSLPPLCSDSDSSGISLTEDMNSLMRNNSTAPSGSSSSSDSSILGATTSPSTEGEDDEETIPASGSATRNSFGRTILLSSDDSDLDLVLSSPRADSSSTASSSHGSHVRSRTSRTTSRDRVARAFPQTSSSSSERVGGGTAAFHGRRCRQRIFTGKKHGRGRDESSSPGSACRPSEPEPVPLQPDLTSPHAPRRSRVFSSRRYHHVSPRARLEERTTDRGPSQHRHAASANVFSGSPTFRRDDPGRRPLTRSVSQGRRVVRPSSPQNRSENYVPNYVRSLPDVFDAESDESTEFFTASSSPSESEDRRRTGTPPPAAGAENGTRGIFAGGDVTRRGEGRLRRRSRFATSCAPQNDNSDDEVRTTFPTGLLAVTFHTSPGRRQRRGTRSRRRRVSSEREISSPDPVLQVQQVEEDERMARMLQAQFDAEVQVPHQSPMLPESEEDPSIVVDRDTSEGSSETSLSSESSASSRQEEMASQPYVRRARRNATGNWRRRGTSQRSWQPPRINMRRPTHIHSLPLINLLAFSVSQDEYDYEELWNIVQTVGEVMPRGLLSHQLNRLPTRKYGGEDEAKSKECLVCLSEFEKQDLLRILPCFHEFHAACIDKWLPTNRTCPVCRAEVEVD